jgi:hypothetical protein
MVWNLWFFLFCGVVVVGSSYMYLYVSLFLCVFGLQAFGFLEFLGCNCAFLCGVRDWVLVNVSCDFCRGCEGFSLNKFKCLEFGVEIV